MIVRHICLLLAEKLPCKRNHADEEDPEGIVLCSAEVSGDGPLSRWHHLLLTGVAGPASRLEQAIYSRNSRVYSRNVRMIGSEFLGKRSSPSPPVQQQNQQQKQRQKQQQSAGQARRGKRAVASSRPRWSDVRWDLLGKRVLGSEFLGKRALVTKWPRNLRPKMKVITRNDLSSDMTTKLGRGLSMNRADETWRGKRLGSEFIGKRMGKRMGSEFIGKRLGIDSMGKRLGSEFIGKRTGSELVEKRHAKYTMNEGGLHYPTRNSHQKIPTQRLKGLVSRPCRSCGEIGILSTGGNRNIPAIYGELCEDREETSRRTSDEEEK